MAFRLGELLEKMSFITQKQLDEALKTQTIEGGRIGETLVRMGLTTEQGIYEALSKQFGIPMINLENTKIDEDVISLLPLHTVRRYNIMPVRKKGNILTIAIVDPTKIFDLKEIKIFTGYDIEPLLTSETEIAAAIEKYYGTTHNLELKKLMDDLGATDNVSLEIIEEEETGDVAKLESDAKQPPVVQIVNHMFTEAIKKGASDIHIEPYENEVRIRYRIDGVLYEIIKLPLKYKDGVSSRIKVLSRMDIAEKRLPQDGRIKIQMKLDGRMKSLDIRVSSTPTLFGEKIVMRLLDKEGLMLDMRRLGFEPESLNNFEEAIFKPWGMVLVTGPTGSGKTNTLYSAIGRINTPEVNIMTVEDPVEFNINGINQVQVQEGIGLSFASVLRSFLRQDPNVILVGEIRDNETAEIAVKASLTGHLVLSTLHTNDAPSAITRLVDMGIDSFLVATSVILIAAQRLVRKICPECKEEMAHPPRALMNIGFSEEDANTVRIYKGNGCSRCNNTGYKGRIGLFEIMPVTPPIRELVFTHANASEMRRKAIEEGMITLRQSGLIKIKNGVTTIEEVIRETF
ncbi:MAG: type IV-A pilus assembly ATPase PilB [Syntrophus sp. (in: bacteria)]|nr:type IV-A pilus assembly ATPase PilB [Syntrophus sp. (in: bacteria)]